MITLDFETYYAADYTLSKMTTEEYVRDPRFKCHMVGLKFDTNPACYYPPEILHVQAIRDLITTQPVLCHHAHFDGLILGHHFGLRPGMWLDTLSMARLVLPHSKSHSLGKLAEAYQVGQKNLGFLTAVKGHRDLSTDQFESLGAYCAADVEMTYELFQRMKVNFPVEEFQLIDQTVRMFTQPVLWLNAPRLTLFNDAVIREKAAALAQLGITKQQIRSNETMCQVLLYLGVEPPMKPSPTNPTLACRCTNVQDLNGNWHEGQEPDPGCLDCGGFGEIDNLVPAFAKTDDGMKALLAHDDYRVQAVAEARIDAKSTLTESRCARLLSAWSRGALPVYINYAGAHTLRWSGGDKMNWQNLPTVTFKDGQECVGAAQKGEIRRSVVAPDGYVIGVADAAQIECRALNTLAEQWDIVQMFSDGRDIYSEGATKFYGRVVTKADKTERWLGKRMELGCGYGIGWAKFQTQCRQGDPSGMSVILDDDTAKNAVKSYRWNHAQVTTLWKHAAVILQALYDRVENMAWGPMVVHQGRIYGPGGSWLDYTNLFCNDGAKRDRWYTIDRHGKHARMYGPKLVENVIQWLCRIILGAAMLRMRSRGIWIATCTHDETVAVLPELQAQSQLAIMMEEIKRPVPWMPHLPLDAEGGFAREYSK